MTDHVVVSCSLAGAASNRQQCPYIPFTPEEFAEEARRAAEAGAAVVRVHPRRLDGTPSHDPADAIAIVEAIRARVPEAVIELATNLGPHVRDRATVVREARPDIAATAVGSMNYALRREGRFVLDAVLSNPFEDVRTMLDAIDAAGAAPNHECFDAGHVNNVALLHDGSSGERLRIFTLVLGVDGCAPASTATLVHLQASLPRTAAWFAAGVRYPDQWQIVAASLSLGGGVRVGFEDNFYVDAGAMATSNADLVGKAVRMARDVGRDVADGARARSILGLRPRQQAGSGAAG